MDKWKPQISSDGAFERFLTAAIATIITIIFSWRMLDKINDDDREDEDDPERHRLGNFSSHSASSSFVSFSSSPVDDGARESPLNRREPTPGVLDKYSQLIPQMSHHFPGAKASNEMGESPTHRVPVDLPLCGVISESPKGITWDSSIFRHDRETLGISDESSVSRDINNTGRESPGGFIDPAEEPGAAGMKCGAEARELLINADRFSATSQVAGISSAHTEHDAVCQGNAYVPSSRDNHNTSYNSPDCLNDDLADITDSSVEEGGAQEVDGNLEELFLDFNNEHRRTDYNNFSDNNNFSYNNNFSDNNFSDNNNEENHHQFADENNPTDDRSFDDNTADDFYNSYDESQYHDDYDYFDDVEPREIDSEEDLFCCSILEPIIEENSEDITSSEGDNTSLDKALYNLTDPQLNLQPDNNQHGLTPDEIILSGQPNYNEVSSGNTPLDPANSTAHSVLVEQSTDVVKSVYLSQSGQHNYNEVSSGNTPLDPANSTAHSVLVEQRTDVVKPVYLSQSGQPNYNEVSSGETPLDPAYCEANSVLPEQSTGVVEHGHLSHSNYRTGDLDINEGISTDAKFKLATDPDDKLDTAAEMRSGVAANTTHADKVRAQITSIEDQRSSAARFLHSNSDFTNSVNSLGSRFNRSSGASVSGFRGKDNERVNVSEELKVDRAELELSPEERDPIVSHSFVQTFTARIEAEDSNSESDESVRTVISRQSSREPNGSPTHRSLFSPSRSGFDRVKRETSHSGSSKKWPSSGSAERDEVRVSGFDSFGDKIKEDADLTQGKAHFNQDSYQFNSGQDTSLGSARNVGMADFGQFEAKQFENEGRLDSVSQFPGNRGSKYGDVYSDRGIGLAGETVRGGGQTEVWRNVDAGLSGAQDGIAVDPDSWIYPEDESDQVDKSGYDPAGDDEGVEGREEEEEEGGESDEEWSEEVVETFVLPVSHERRGEGVRSVEDLLSGRTRPVGGYRSVEDLLSGRRRPGSGRSVEDLLSGRRMYGGYGSVLVERRPLGENRSVEDFVSGRRGPGGIRSVEDLLSGRRAFMDYPSVEDRKGGGGGSRSVEELLDEGRGRGEAENFVSNEEAEEEDDEWRDEGVETIVIPLSREETVLQTMQGVKDILDGRDSGGGASAAQDDDEEEEDHQSTCTTSMIDVEGQDGVGFRGHDDVMSWYRSQGQELSRVDKGLKEKFGFTLNLDEYKTDAYATEDGGPVVRMVERERVFIDEFGKDEASSNENGDNFRQVEKNSQNDGDDGNHDFKPAQPKFGGRFIDNNTENDDENEEEGYTDDYNEEMEEPTSVSTIPERSFKYTRLGSDSPALRPTATQFPMGHTSVLTTRLIQYPFPPSSIQDQYPPSSIQDPYPPSSLQEQLPPSSNHDFSYSDAKSPTYQPSNLPDRSTIRNIQLPPPIANKPTFKPMAENRDYDSWNLPTNSTPNIQDDPRNYVQTNEQHAESLNSSERKSDSNYADFVSHISGDEPGLQEQYNILLARPSSAILSGNIASDSSKIRGFELRADEQLFTNTETSPPRYKFKDDDDKEEEESKMINEKRGIESWNETEDSVSSTKPIFARTSTAESDDEVARSAAMRDSSPVSIHKDVSPTQITRLNDDSAIHNFSLEKYNSSSINFDWKSIGKEEESIQEAETIVPRYVSRVLPQDLSVSGTPKPLKSSIEGRIRDEEDQKMPMGLANKSQTPPRSTTISTPASSYVNIPPVPSYVNIAPGPSPVNTPPAPLPVNIPPAPLPVNSSPVIQFRVTRFIPASSSAEEKRAVPPGSDQTFPLSRPSDNIQKATPQPDQTRIEHRTGLTFADTESEPPAPTTSNWSHPEITGHVFPEFNRSRSPLPFTPRNPEADKTRLLSATQITSTAKIPFIPVSTPICATERISIIRGVDRIRGMGGQPQSYYNIPALEKEKDDNHDTYKKEPSSVVDKGGEDNRSGDKSSEEEDEYESEEEEDDDGEEEDDEEDDEEEDEEEEEEEERKSYEVIMINAKNTTPADKLRKPSQLEERNNDISHENPFLASSASYTNMSSGSSVAPTWQTTPQQQSLFTPATQSSGFNPQPISGSPKKTNSMKEIRKRHKQPYKSILNIDPSTLTSPKASPFILPDHFMTPSRTKIVQSRNKFLSEQNLHSATFAEEFAAHKEAPTPQPAPVKNRMYMPKMSRHTNYRSQEQLEKIKHMISLKPGRSEGSLGSAGLHDDCILSEKGRREILDKTLSIETLDADLHKYLLKLNSQTEGQASDSFFPETNSDMFDLTFPFQDDLDRYLNRPASMGELRHTYNYSTISGPGLTIFDPTRSRTQDRNSHREYNRSKSVSELENNQGTEFESANGPLERSPSAHELRISKSLQKLNAATWYKNPTISRSGSSLNYGFSSRSPFAQSPTATSSLSTTPSSTPNVVIKSRVQLPTSSRNLRSPLPSSKSAPTTPPFPSKIDSKPPTPKSPVTLPSEKLRTSTKSPSLQQIPIVPFHKLTSQLEKKKNEDSKKSKQEQQNNVSNLTLKSPISSNITPQNNNIIYDTLKGKTSQVSVVPTNQTAINKPILRNSEPATNQQANAQEKLRGERQQASRLPATNPDISEKGIKVPETPSPPSNQAVRSILKKQHDEPIYSNILAKEDEDEPPLYIPIPVKVSRPAPAMTLARDPLDYVASSDSQQPFKRPGTEKQERPSHPPSFRSSVTEKPERPSHPPSFRSSVTEKPERPSDPPSFRRSVTEKPERPSHPPSFNRPVTERPDLPTNPPSFNRSLTKRPDLPINPPPFNRSVTERPDLPTNPPSFNRSGTERPDLPTNPPSFNRSVTERPDLPTNPPSFNRSVTERPDLPTNPPSFRPSVTETPELTTDLVVKRPITKPKPTPRPRSIELNPTDKINSEPTPQVNQQFPKEQRTPDQGWSPTSTSSTDNDPEKEHQFDDVTNKHYLDLNKASLDTLTPDMAKPAPMIIVTPGTPRFPGTHAVNATAREPKAPSTASTATLEKAPIVKLSFPRPFIAPVIEDRSPSEPRYYHVAPPITFNPQKISLYGPHDDDDLGSESESGMTYNTKPSAGTIKSDFATPSAGTIKSDFATPSAGTIKSDFATPSAGTIKSDFATPSDGTIKSQFATPSAGTIKSEFATPTPDIFKPESAIPNTDTFNPEHATTGTDKKRSWVPKRKPSKRRKSPDGGPDQDDEELNSSEAPELRSKIEPEFSEYTPRGFSSSTELSHPGLSSSQYTARSSTELNSPRLSSTSSELNSTGKQVLKQPDALRNPELTTQADTSTVNSNIQGIRLTEEAEKNRHQSQIPFFNQDVSSKRDFKHSSQSYSSSSSDTPMELAHGTTERELTLESNPDFNERLDQVLDRYSSSVVQNPSRWSEREPDTSTPTAEDNNIRGKELTQGDNSHENERFGYSEPPRELKKWQPRAKNRNSGSFKGRRDGVYERKERPNERPVEVDERPNEIDERPVEVDERPNEIDERPYGRIEVFDSHEYPKNESNRVEVFIDRNMVYDRREGGFSKGDGGVNTIEGGINHGDVRYGQKKGGYAAGDDDDSEKGGHGYESGSEIDENYEHPEGGFGGRGVDSFKGDSGSDRLKGDSVQGDGGFVGREGGYEPVGYDGNESGSGRRESGSEAGEGGYRNEKGHFNKSNVNYARGESGSGTEESGSERREGGSERERVYYDQSKSGRDLRENDNGIGYKDARGAQRGGRYPSGSDDPQWSPQEDSFSSTHSETENIPLRGDRVENNNNNNVFRNRDWVAPEEGHRVSGFARKGRSSSDLYRESRADSDLYRESRADSDLYRESRADSDLSRESRADSDLSRESRADSDLSRESRADSDLSRESRADSDLSRESRGRWGSARASSRGSEASRDSSRRGSDLSRDTIRNSSLPRDGKRDSSLYKDNRRDPDLSRDSILSRDRESILSRDRESIVSRDRESILSRDRDSVLSRDRESILSRDRESIVSRDSRPESKLSRDTRRDSILSRDSNMSTESARESTVSRNSRRDSNLSKESRQDSTVSRDTIRESNKPGNSREYPNPSGDSRRDWSLPKGGFVESTPPTNSEVRSTLPRSSSSQNHVSNEEQAGSRTSLVTGRTWQPKPKKSRGLDPTHPRRATSAGNVHTLPASLDTNGGWNTSPYRFKVSGSAFNSTKPGAVAGLPASPASSPKMKAASMSSLLTSGSESRNETTV